MLSMATRVPGSAAIQERGHLLPGGSWEAERGPQALSHAPLLRPQGERHACTPARAVTRSLHMPLTAHETEGRDLSILSLRQTDAGGGEGGFLQDVRVQLLNQ